MRFRINLDALRSVIKKAGTFFSKDSSNFKDVQIVVRDTDPNDAGKRDNRVIFRCGGKFSALEVIVRDGVDVETCGETTLQFEILNKIVANAKGEYADFNSTFTTVFVGIGKGQFNLPVVPPVLQPDISVEKANGSIKIPADKFCKIARVVALYADDNASSIQFSGVFFNQVDDRVDVVATDTRCMCLGKIGIEEGYGNNFKNAIVPKSQVEVAASIFETCLSEDGLITLYTIDDNRCIFTDGYTTYSAGIICGTYPKYDSVFDKKGYFRLNLDAKEMISDLNQSKICTTEMFRGVVLTLQNGVLYFSSESPETGKAVIQMEYPTSDSGTVKIDCGFILKAIKSAGTENITFSFPENGNNPVVINKGEELQVAVMTLSMGK